MSPPFPEPQFLMPYPEDPQVSDYRPVVNSTGTHLLFERTFPGSDPPQPVTLYLLQLDEDCTEAKPFLPEGPTGQARADWCRTIVNPIENPLGEVAFATPQGIWLVHGDGSHLRRVEGTAGMVYPAWYPDGHHLAVMNSSASADPNPCSTRIDRKGQTQESPLAGFQVYGGMPSVNQQYPYLLAFAGQLIPRLPAPYNENFNYVWVADAQTGTVAPLDRNAPQDRYDPAYQSRAPWWSPDGRWVAFESNRLCPGAGTGMGYALFLQDAEGLKPPIQVTDPDWDAQHAKWIDDGTLVATLFQKRSSKKVPRGIATLDVSALISG